MTTTGPQRSTSPGDSHRVTPPQVRLSLEYVSSPDDLRVLRILDLQPRRCTLIGLTTALRPLTNNPFQVALARCTKQINSALVDVIEGTARAILSAP